MTPKLIEFLKAYSDWQRSGAIEEEPFTRSMGLCDNCWYWALCYYPGHLHAISAELTTAMGGIGYPFNKSPSSSNKENLYKRNHLNRKRINWVRKALKEPDYYREK